jgi:shikimate kinase
LFYPELPRPHRDRAADNIPTGPSLVPLIVLCGSPGAGKTTIARELAAPGDLVLDLDEIQARLSGLPLYEAGDQWLDPAIEERNRKLRSLTSTPPLGRAWLVATAPGIAERRLWETRMGALVLMVDTPLDECLSRLRLDAQRRDVSKHEEFARRWWTRYAADPGETCVRTAEQARAAVEARFGVPEGLQDGQP